MTMSTFIPIFVAFIVIFFSVMISATVKSEKKKKNQSASAQNARPRLDDDLSQSKVDDPFGFDERTSSEKKPTPVRKYVEPVRSDSRRPFNEVRGVNGTDLVETRPKVHASAQVVGIAKSHHDDHCDVDSHEDEDLYIVEKVPVSGSIGGESDEGCKEHYNLRYVKIEEKEDGGSKLVISADDVRKAIILGEVINDPAYKK